MLATTVAALGYFVDIFDLLLFALVRVRSLKDLLAPEIAAAQQKLLETARFTDAASMERAKDMVADNILRDAGVMLDNILQMTGLVVGVAQAPDDPYFAQSLQAWEQGRFVRFHGLAQWIGWLWPYAAMGWMMSRLGGRR